MSSTWSGVSSEEKQMERKSRRWRRAISSRVSVTALDQISFSPAIEELPSRQTTIGPFPFSSIPFRGPLAGALEDLLAQRQGVKFHPANHFSKLLQFLIPGKPLAQFQLLPGRGTIARSQSEA